MIYLVVLSYGLICYLIGEFFGRAKHIGRWWTMFLFWSAPIPLIGLLALIFSPSAKKSQISKYNSIWVGLGILFLLLSLIALINIFSTDSTLRQFGYVFFIALAIHSIYFILLGANKIINSNPKYYFNYININLPKPIVEQKTESDTANLKKDKSEDLKVDHDISRSQTSGINENDGLIQLQKLFDLGIVNLEEFNAKKILIDEKRIAEDELRQKELEAKLAEESFKKKLEEEAKLAEDSFKKKLEEKELALKILESLWNKNILTWGEYSSKVAKINENGKLPKNNLKRSLNKRNYNLKDSWAEFVQDIIMILKSVIIYVIIIIFIVFLCFLIE